MPLPETYLAQAPQGLDDQMGRCLSSTDFIKKLKECNPQITVPTQEHYTNQGWVFPGAHLAGQTSIWWGQPPGPGDIKFASTKPNRQAMKIASVVLGPTIPEFTQFNTQTGTIEQKGWREIIRRMVMGGVASKATVERVFNVSLDYDGTDGRCKACSRKGLKTKSIGAKGLCVDHHMAVLGFSERQEFINYLMKQSAMKGDSQVGYTGKEDMCLSSPSTDQKLRQKMSGSPSQGLPSLASTPSPRNGGSGPAAS